jgi:hypothetical protein
MRFELQTQIGIGESTGKPRNRSFHKALKNPAPEAFPFSISKEGVRITLTEDRKIPRTRHGSKTEE